MRRQILAEVTGTDARRVKVLAAKPRAARFMLGELVRDPHGEVGAIDAIYADLQAAEDAGVIDDAAAWLRVQEKRPKTPNGTTYYSVVLGSGQVLCGERDLQLAKPTPAGAKMTKAPPAKRKRDR